MKGTCYLVPVDKSRLALAGLLMFCLAANVQAVFKGPYLGAKPPGVKPEPFMPELFNVHGYLHGRLVFSPDGRELFWELTTAQLQKRLYLRQDESGFWRGPADAFLSAPDAEKDICFSADGRRVFYQSRAARRKGGAGNDSNIWFREKRDGKWGEPVCLEPPVNLDESDETSPWLGQGDLLVFCRTNDRVQAGASGGSDILYCRSDRGKFNQPLFMGPEINSEFHEANPVLAPDNSYLLFTSNRPGGFSRMMNLYVSFRTTDGGWSKARCLSHELKIENIWFPSLSYDGKFLFFCGGYPGAHGYTQSRYYWVSARIIESLKPSARHDDQQCGDNSVP